jgi:GntR family phosphonate transport system transcriptional regulator
MTRPIEPGNGALHLPDPAHSHWARIANEIAQAIRDGNYLPGDRLPSEHALAEQHRVNRHTVRHAVTALAQQGLLRSERGRGTYVEEFAVELVLGKRPRHRQNLAHSGLKGGFSVVSARTEPADASVARALNLRTGKRVLHLVAIGDGGGYPLHVSDRYLPLPRFKGIDALVQSTGSITESLAHFGVADYTRRSSRISARLPDLEIATHLRQASHRPALQVTSVNVDTCGTPIEFARTWFAGDRVTLTLDHDDA